MMAVCCNLDCESWRELIFANVTSQNSRIDLDLFSFLRNFVFLSEDDCSQIIADFCRRQVIKIVEDYYRNLVVCEPGDVAGKTVDATVVRNQFVAKLLIDYPAIRIIIFERRENRIQALLRNQSFGIQGLIPYQQILDGRIKGTRRKR